MSEHSTWKRIGVSRIGGYGLAANARYRRVANASGHFPNEQAALKRIYLAALALDPSGKGEVCWANRWKEALNAFDIKFDGRVSTGRR